MINVKKLLSEFPELWALHCDWSIGPDVKVCRASAINFLNQPLRPSEGMDRISRVFMVKRSPWIEEYEETYKGERLIEEATRDKDLSIHLSIVTTMTGDTIKYFFLCEQKAGSPRIDRIVIVKPPLGRKHFGGYVNRLRIQNPKWVA